jgi:hypothetical protein
MVVVFFFGARVRPVGDDTPWRHQGRAWSTGYLKALIDAVNALA